MILITTLLQNWILQHLSANEMANEITKLVHKDDWARFFCFGPDGLINYIRDPPIMHDGSDAGICVNQASALQIIHSCIESLAGFLPPWLLKDSGSAITSFKMILDLTTGCKILNGDVVVTDIAVITFRKADTITGFYVDSVFPLYITGHEKK